MRQTSLWQRDHLTSNVNQIMNIIDLSIIFERVTWGQLSNMMWNWHVMDSTNYYWYMNFLFVGELKNCIDNFRLGFIKVGHEWFITFCWFFAGKRWCPSNMLMMFILCEHLWFFDWYTILNWFCGNSLRYLQFYTKINIKVISYIHNSH